MELGTTTRRREDLCSRYFLALTLPNGDLSRYVAFPMMCKSWDCPDCRQVKAREYRDRMQRIDDGRKLWFLTLTYYHSLSPTEAWKTYNVAWNRLRTNLSKQCGPFDYIRVLESHLNSPYPHLHIIMDMYVKPTVLGPAATAAGFGYQITCKPITSEGAFHYVKKYLTKEWVNKEAWALRKANRCRIVSFSRGLLSPVPKSQGWKSLLIHSDLGACIECINTDIRWRTGEVAHETYKQQTDNFYEVSVEWRDAGPSKYYLDSENWAPDDWCPI